LNAKWFKIPVQDLTPLKIQGSLAAKERKERKEQLINKGLHYSSRTFVSLRG
jgi:hypothetical protein